MNKTLFLTKILGVIFFAVFTQISACQKQPYGFRIFTYPEEIPWHDPGWKYSVTVLITSTGKMNKEGKGPKRVDIIVRDSSDNKLFNESMSFEKMENMMSNAVWTQLNQFELTIFEYGNEGWELDPKSKNANAIISEDQIVVRKTYDFRLQ